MFRQASGGELSKLLANRSMGHLKQGDFEAALEDAEEPEHPTTHLKKTKLK